MGTRTPIPVLLYHGVTLDPSSAMAPFSVTPREFDAHMELVQESGRQLVPASALADVLSTGFAAENVAAVTFDDGLHSFLDHALPVLTDRGIASSLFVTTGWLADAEPTTRRRGPVDRTLSRSEVAFLAGEGVEIGAHSHTHPHMDTLNSADAEREITQSKRVLEDVTGTTVTSFAYPHGYQSPRLRQQVRGAGFRCALGVRNGLTAPGDEMFNIARLTVMADTTREQVRAWLAGEGAPVADPHERLRTRAHRVVRRSRAIATGRPGTVWG